LEGDLKLNSSILDSLREGGYILYARHGEATIGNDQPNLDFQNCATQRNLSEFGRRQAVYYGEILRYWQIPLYYPIIASPFCRALDTAQLAFGSANIQPDPFLTEVYKLSGNLTALEHARIQNAFNTMLETRPPQGSNQVIIAHGFSFGIGLNQIQNMGTVIVKPLGLGNGYEIIHRLSLEDWGNLARLS
jgi:broad specificity phosphatase PhoE